MIKMNKKTNFPDLERLPKTNFWKHLFNYWWNRPRVFVEDIIEKYILKSQEKEKRLDLELERLNREIEHINEITRLHLKLSELKKNRK
tara:strand:+ start:2505 stop:2768 length:264 start_codon:yes stop_codon:yes gene_type:complete